MKRLRACEGCARHVFVGEPVCPFCKRELEAAPAARDVNIPSGASRAQRLALVAALGGQGLVACTAADTSATVTPIYGAPAPIAGKASAAGTSAQLAAGSGASGRPAAGSGGAKSSDPGVAMPVYGAPLAGQPGPVKPPVADAGADEEDAGAAHADAGVRHDGGPMVQPLYGAPAPVYGAPPTPKKD